MNTAILGALVANPSVLVGKFFAEALPGAAIAYGLVWWVMRPKDGRKVPSPFLSHAGGVFASVTGGAIFRIIAIATFAGRSAFEPAADTGAAAFYIFLVPAVVAAGYIVWLKSQLSNQSRPRTISNSGNDAYAGALAEIEEGRLDKGVWARAFSEAGGEDAKARALYIKARAGAMQGAEVWENTQPLESSDAVIKATVEKATVEVDNRAPVSTPKWPIWIVAGALPVFVLVSFAVSAYKSGPSREVVAGTETGSQPTPQATPAPQVDWTQYTPVNQKILEDQETKRSGNMVPFNGKLDDAPRDARSASAQSDNDKAMKEHFRLVYTAHPDIEAVLASAGFRAWLVKYPAYERIVVKGTAPEVIGMLNTYKKQNQLPGAAAQSPNAFYKCKGPSGVLYQATPCGTASN